MSGGFESASCRVRRPHLSDVTISQAPALRLVHLGRTDRRTDGVTDGSVTWPPSWGDLTTKHCCTRDLIHAGDSATNGNFRIHSSHFSSSQWRYRSPNPQFYLCTATNGNALTSGYQSECKVYSRDVCRPPVPHVAMPYPNHGGWHITPPTPIHC